MHLVLSAGFHGPSLLRCHGLNVSFPGDEFLFEVPLPSKSHSPSKNSYLHAIWLAGSDLKVRVAYVQYNRSHCHIRLLCYPLEQRLEPAGHGLAMRIQEHQDVSRSSRLYFLVITCFFNLFYLLLSVELVSGLLVVCAGSVFKRVSCNSFETVYESNEIPVV